MLVTRARTAAVRPDHMQANPELFDDLRALRKRIADERNVPPYVIFHDRTLQEMAGRLPSSIDELMRLPGIGTAKASSFGDEFLETIRSYADARGLRRAASSSRPVPPNARPAEAPRGRRIAGSSMRETLDLFREGRSVADIARERGLALSTIEGHLADGLEAGEEIDVDRLIAADKLDAINDVLRMAGETTLTEIQSQLGDDFSFVEIRVARALKRYA